MTILEFFVNPVGTEERYELNGDAASSAFLRLWELRESIEFEGELSFGFAQLSNVPSNIVLMAIDGLGGAHVGKTKQPGRGEAIDQIELFRRIEKHALHNIDYFDI